jgi:hypothetical protein
LPCPTTPNRWSTRREARFNPRRFARKGARETARRPQKSSALRRLRPNKARKIRATLQNTPLAKLKPRALVFMDLTAAASPSARLTGMRKRHAAAMPRL